ncbi:MAG: prolipoprotein diacylglyceryl transferase family protein, partial [Alphaproteobacteria bacterium]
SCAKYPCRRATAMKFPTFNWDTQTWHYTGDEKLVHPSQLYESGLEGLVLFTVLAICVWRFGTLKRPGLTAGIFLIGYSLSRTLLENFRAPDSFVAGLPSFLTMGMLLSIPMLLLGAWLVVRANRTPKPA